VTEPSRRAVHPGDRGLARRLLQSGPLDAPPPAARPARAAEARLRVLHAFASLAYLALALLLGLALAFTPPAEWKLRAALVYGVFGLVGFLSQMVVGVSRRLLPLFAWLRA
jgi:hypothetical protein